MTWIAAAALVALFTAQLPVSRSPEGGVRQADLVEFLQSYDCRNADSEPRYASQELCAAIDIGADPPQVIERFARATRLTREAAVSLIEAILGEHEIEKSSERASDTQIHRIEENLLDALELSGGSPHVARELGSFYSRRMYFQAIPSRPSVPNITPSRGLEQTLARLDGDRNVVLAILGGLVDVVDPTGEAEFDLFDCTPAYVLYQGLALNPDDADLLLLASNYTIHRGLRIALASAANHSRDRAGTESLAHDLAPYRALAELMRAGLLEEAARMVEAFEPSLLARIADGDLQALPQLAPALLLDLAATYQLLGDSKRAASYLARSEPPDHDSALATPPEQEPLDDDARWILEMRSRLMEHLLQADWEDPFDLITEVIETRNLLEEGVYETDLWTRTLTEVMRRGSYDDAVSFIQQQQYWRAKLLKGDGWKCGAEQLPPFLLDEATDYQAQIDAGWSAEHSRIARELSTDGDSSESPIRRSLATPRLRPFTERPLPSQVPPAPLPGKPPLFYTEPRPYTDEEAEEARKFLDLLLAGADLEASANTAELDEMMARLEEEVGKVRRFEDPVAADFRPVRREEVNGSVLEIGLSRSLDPVGELPTSGYWLRLTDSTGQQTMTYLGLRLHHPYVVTKRSELPLIQSDRLQIEVRREALIEDSIVFPPIHLRFSETERGVLIEASLADLVRDSDGDGLTDLVEERLLTDPLSGDTDGDGLLDSKDPIPHIAYVPGESASGPWGQLLETIAGVESVEPDEGSRPLAERPTLFWVGHSEGFQGLWPDRRIVVLTPRDTWAYTEKFGETFFHKMTFLLIDSTRTRVFAVWSQGWRGGTLRFEKGEDGEWKTDFQSDWIT